MLGLGSSLTNASVVEETLSFANAPVFYLAPTNTVDSGDIVVGAEKSNTSFDLRLLINTADFDESSDSASDFTLTNLSITNNTTGGSQFIASSVTMDNFIDFLGADQLYFFTDAGGPVDNLDFSSDSGEAAAHNGVSSNSYTIAAQLLRAGSPGSFNIQKTINLTNS